MKIAFFSNYLTHHQTPFCEELQKLGGVSFTFVACEPIEQERLAMGFEDMNRYPYVLRAYEGEQEQKKAEKLCLDCDILIHGSAPDKFLLSRAESGKPMFKISERMFKKGQYQVFSPRTIKRMKNTHSSFKNKQAYLLCASAFSSDDFAHFGAYKNKAYKWGYFPEVKKHDDIKALINKKKPASLLWVARMIELKHPEYVVSVAKRLKEEGYNFTLDMIGNGVLEGKIRTEVISKGLEDCVKLHGSMSPEEVREHMEQAETFLFTSDRHEGWGAVLNESMNSGCAVVASHIIGSVPFLVTHGQNGLIYKDGNVSDLYKKVKFLLDAPEQRKQLGKEAYHTLEKQWNPENAAKRFYCLAAAVLRGEHIPELFEDGICSKAERLKDDWFKNNC